MRRARMKSVAVVFHLHNFGYNDRRAFADHAKPTGKNRKTDLTTRSRPDPAKPT
jgi:hypothetical protein